MKTRFFSFLLVVAVLCSCMTVTTYAAETGGSTLNLLDFTDVREYTADSLTYCEIQIELPYTVYLTDFEIILYALDTDGNPLELTTYRLSDPDWVSMLGYEFTPIDGNYVAAVQLASPRLTRTLTLYVVSPETDDEYTVYLEQFNLTVTPESYIPDDQTTLLYKIWQCLKKGDLLGAGNEIWNTISAKLSTIQTTISSGVTKLYNAIASFDDNVTMWLEEIWMAITGDTSQSDEFQDEVDDKTNELETMAGIMDSVETPDDFRPDLNTETDDIQYFVGEGGLGYVITSPYILPLFVVSMTFCFVSYALYGKKG